MDILSLGRSLIGRLFLLVRRGLFSMSYEWLLRAAGRREKDARGNERGRGVGKEGGGREREPVIGR